MDAASKRIHSSAQRRAWLLLPLRLGLAALFLFASVSKLANFVEIRSVVNQGALLPPGFVGLIAGLLVLSEFIVGLGLLIPRFRVEATWGALGLAALFFSYGVVRWVFALPAPCGCLGAFIRLEPHQMLLLNSVLMTIAFSILEHELRRRMTRSNAELPFSAA